MDAFFASVEQRDFPEYRGKPLIVGGSHARGVVAAASYEARKYGIRSAMPAKRAFALCPDLIAARPRFDVYKAVSLQIRAIFKEYTDLVEPLAFDEAFLDVTENKKGIVLAQDIAKEIKVRIKTELNLTASAGVSYNKFLAKIASDMQKPDGLTVIHPKKAPAIIDQLPIEAFWGVGEVTARRMHELGITNGRELKMQSEEFLISHFGKPGKLFAEFARGEDHRIVNPERERLSVGCERTFTEDISDPEEIKDKFDYLAEELQSRISRAGFRGSTFTLKIKRDDFRIISRSKTCDEYLFSADRFRELSDELFQLIDLHGHGIRLAGFSVSNPKARETAEPETDSQLTIPFDKEG